jgi:hypothetical protein
MSVMEKYIVQQSDITPEMQMDPVSGYMQITGTSIPENSEEVYRPVLDWIRKYEETPARQTLLDIRLDYFNTSSSKFLLEIIRVLKRIQDNQHEVKLRWFYYEDDPDMLEAGQDFMDIADIHLEMVKIEEKH